MAVPVTNYNAVLASDAGTAETANTNHGTNRRKPPRPRNTLNDRANALRSPAAPEPPIVASELLGGGQISFLEFLTGEGCGAYCALLFGNAGTAAGTMLQELPKSKEFHYFGHRRSLPGRQQARNPGRLTDSKAATKNLLKKYARLAYRGDADRRGVLYWERIAGLLWDAYSGLMALRARAAVIQHRETKRLAGLPRKRAARAAYMRRYRAKRAAMFARRYFKEDAKAKWRQRRSLRRTPTP